MKTEALFLLLILILGLFLCSFLGGNCDKEGFTSTSTNLLIGTTFTDTNGNTITVIAGSNGTQSLQLVQVGQSTPIILSSTPPTGMTAAAANTYYAQPPLKMTATVVSGSNGQNAININLANGQTITLTETGSSGSSGSTSSSSSSFTSSSSSPSLSTTGTAIPLQNGTVFTDVSGNTITIIVNSDGSQSLQLIQVSQPTPIILVSTPPQGTTAAVNTYYAQGPLKMTANVYTGSDGQTAIQVNLAGGQTIIFSQHGSAAVSSQSNNGSITSTQYYGSTGSPYQTGASSMSYNGAYGGSAGSATGPYGNTAYYAQGPYGNTAAGTASNPYYTQAPSNNSGDYNASLPPGIPASQIPSGQEDLYILKSQVVPPVCPVCPACKNSSNNDPDSAPKCPPCPPCARCPEPSFECKKVPNYSSINNSYLPQPIINSFSSFGM